MKRHKLEVYSSATNSAVVRMHDRNYPGVVLQGDSLSILFDNAMTIVEALDGQIDKTFFSALDLAEKLEAHLRHYEATLHDHGIDLPYVRDPNRSAGRYSYRWDQDLGDELSDPDQPPIP